MALFCDKSIAFTIISFIIIILQICIWNTDTWEKRRSIAIQLPAGKAPGGDTRVQFHSDQARLFVSHESQIAIYDALKMERIRQVDFYSLNMCQTCNQYPQQISFVLSLQWVPQDVLSAPISYAVYSCNSQLVYAAFCDGNIGVFDADSLRLRCRIAPSAYLSAAVTNR